MKHQEKARAKVKKKASKNHKRLLEARTKVAMVTVAALTQGLVATMQYDLPLSKKEVEQIQRVMRWSNEALDQIDIGVHAVEKSSQYLRKIDEKVKDITSDGRHNTPGHYATAWLMAGFLADEARLHVSSAKKRPWNFLASTTNTMAGLLLDRVQGDETDYEAEGGRLAEEAWLVIFNTPKQFFAKL